MAEVKNKPIHVGKNGPGPCGATKRACPLLGFDDYAAAEAHFAGVMADEGYEVVTTITRFGNRRYKKVDREAREEGKSAPTRESEAFHYDRERIVALREKLSEKRPEEYTLQELVKIGSELSREINARFRGRYGRGLDRSKLAIMDQYTSDLLKDLGGAAPIKAEITGPLAKPLREALDVLPPSALKWVTGKVNTERVPQGAAEDGWYYGALISVEKSADVTMERTALPEDYELNKLYVSRREFVSDEELLWDSKPAIAYMPVAETGSLDGENLVSLHVASGADFTQDTMKKLQGLRDEGILDDQFVVIDGKSEDLVRSWPESAEFGAKTVKVRQFRIGTPKEEEQTFGRWVRVSDTTVLDGNRELPVPLYEYMDKSFDNSGVTIAAKEHDGGYNGSTMVHEFTHALQGAYPGGFPGEKELFESFKAKDDTAYAVSGHEWTYHAGFPDKYMGHTGGQEVATRATEGILKSANDRNDNTFFFSHEGGNPEAVRVRQWILGAWATLAVRGRNELYDESRV